MFKTPVSLRREISWSKLTSPLLALFEGWSSEVGKVLELMMVESRLVFVGSGNVRIGADLKLNVVFSRWTGETKGRTL